MAEYKFKEGDIIKMTQDCSPLKLRDVCTVQFGTLNDMSECCYVTPDNKPHVKGTDNYCSGYWHWKLVTKKDRPFEAGDRSIKGKKIQIATPTLKEFKSCVDWFMSQGVRFADAGFIREEVIESYYGSYQAETRLELNYFGYKDYDHITYGSIEHSEPKQYTYQEFAEEFMEEGTTLTKEDFRAGVEAAEKMAPEQVRIPGRGFWSFSFKNAYNKQLTPKPIPTILGNQKLSIHPLTKSEFMECLRWFDSQGIEWSCGATAMEDAEDEWSFFDLGEHHLEYGFDGDCSLTTDYKLVPGHTLYTFQQFKDKFIINPLTPKTMGEDSMSLIDKVALTFKSEPQKSFQKAGITDKEDTLTSEGTHVFMHYLLKKFGDDFKKEVADPILKVKKGKK